MCVTCRIHLLFAESEICRFYFTCVNKTEHIMNVKVVLNLNTKHLMIRKDMDSVICTVNTGSDISFHNRSMLRDHV
jgi:hypothetical protein